MMNIKPRLKNSATLSQSWSLTNMRAETVSVPVLHPTVYRIYEYLILGGLTVTAVGAIVCNHFAMVLSLNQATWVSRGLFVACFFGSYYLVRQPEILEQVGRERNISRQKLLLLKTMVGFMPSAVIIVTYKELLVTDPAAAMKVAGMLCFTWGYLLYHRALADGLVTKPALAYWGVISLIDWVSLAASLQATGWSIGSFQLLCWSLGASSILGAIVWQARGKLTWKPTVTDRWCGGVSGAAMLAWLVGSPNLALAALTLAMATACFPLVLSAAKGSEPALPLAPFALGAFTGLFSVTGWSSWQSWAIPMVGFSSFGGACLLAALAKKPNIP
jgi:hypothetical protein